MTESEQTANTFLQQADDLFQAKKYAEAGELYRKAHSMAREEFNRPVEVEAAAQVARVCLILGKREEGQTWLDEAASKTSESDPMGYSRYLGVKGRYEWKAQNLAAARLTFGSMYTFCANQSLSPRAVDAANMLAIVGETVEEQIEWGRRGIAIAESSETENWLGPLWNNLGATYYDSARYAEALECYLKARDYHWRFSDERAKLIADYSIGMTYRMLEQFESALQWLRPSLAWAERLGDTSAIGQAAHDLGEVYLAMQNTGEGLRLLHQAREAYRKAGYETTHPDIWGQINKRIQQVE